MVWKKRELDIFEFYEINNDLINEEQRHLKG